MRAFLISMFVLVLAACQAAPEPVPVAMPNIPPPPAPLPPPPTSNDAQFVGFDTPGLLSGKAYISGNGDTRQLTHAGHPVAFLLLNESDKGRARKICKAYEGLNPVAGEGEEGSDLNRVPLYWMYRTGDAPKDEDVKKRCKKLVDGYNFSRARELKRTWGLGDLKNGTYLVAHDGNPDADEHRIFYIRIDAGTDKQMTDVMEGWFSIAAENPEAEGYAVASKNLITKIWDTFGCDAIGAVTDLVPMGKTVAGIALGKGKCSVG